MLAEAAHAAGCVNGIVPEEGPGWIDEKGDVGKNAIAAGGAADVVAVAVAVPVAQNLKTYERLLARYQDCLSQCLRLRAGSVTKGYVYMT